MIKKQIILLVISAIILIISQLIALAFSADEYQVRKKYSFLNLPGWVQIMPEVSNANDSNSDDPWDDVVCLQASQQDYYGFPFYTVKKVSPNSCKYTIYLNPLASVINLGIIFILFNLLIFILIKIRKIRKKHSKKL